MGAKSRPYGAPGQRQNVTAQFPVRRRWAAVFHRERRLFRFWKKVQIEIHLRSREFECPDGLGTAGSEEFASLGGRGTRLYLFNCDANPADLAHTVSVCGI